MTAPRRRYPRFVYRARVPGAKRSLRTWAKRSRQEPVGVGFWCGGGADPADGWWVRDAGAVLEEVAHLHGVPAAFGKDAGDEVGDVRVE